MPLTQDRMIAIVHEAEGVKEWGIRLKAQIADALAQERERIRRGETPREAANEVLAIVSSLQYILDTNMRPPCEALAIEAAHFRRWSKRNEREKERATRRRRYRGVPEGTSPEGSRTKFAPKGAPQGAPQQDEYSFDENPEITADDVFAAPPSEGRPEGSTFAPPSRDELAAQLAADRELAQELLHDAGFRAITIEPPTPKGDSPKGDKP